MRISDWSSDVCSSDLNNTYITEDSDAVAARVGAEGTEMSVRLAKEAARFDKTPGLSFDTRRKLGILKQGIVLPAPSTPGAAAELNTIATRLQSTHGKGRPAERRIGQESVRSCRFRGEPVH